MIFFILDDDLGHFLRGTQARLRFTIRFGWSQILSIMSSLRSSILVLGFTVVCFSWLANSNGVAHQQNKDRTGAPGSDNTCQQCHGGGNYQPSISAFLVADGDIEVPQYVPGATHTLVVNVSSSGGPVGFGVHGTVVFPDGSNAGTLVDQNATDCIWLDEVEGRHIFEQNDLCSSGFFEVEWVAPPAGSGPVEVYVAAVACNGNGTSSGDAFEGGQFTFNEGLVGVEEREANWMNVRNGEGGRLTLELGAQGHCAVMTMDGRVLFDGSLSIGEHSLLLHHSGWLIVRGMDATGRHFTQRIWMNA